MFHVEQLEKRTVKKMYKFTHIISYAKKLKLKNIDVTVSPIQYDEDKQPFISVTLEKEYETETFIFTKTKNGIFIEWFINGVLYGVLDPNPPNGKILKKF